MNNKNMRIKAGPLYELGKNLVNNKAASEINQQVIEKQDYIEHLRDRTFQVTIDQMEENAVIDRFSEKDKTRVRGAVGEILQQLMADEGKLISRTDRESIINSVTDEITGYGPIDSLVHDPSVIEIMVNGPKKVYIERRGQMIRTNISFKDDAHIRHTIEKIISPLGRRLDETSPMVDARLPDGSRVNAIIPPLSVKGPTLTIRKFSRDPYTIEDLISFGSLTTEMAMFLKACVQGRLNILVSGGTSSGKTTTLNVLSSFIPENERIITIEDAAELQLQQEHVVSLESRPSNIEGKGRVAIRDLVINSLRMRPDRIVVGEVRGGEALDMLQAMNTGHDGSLTTGHANSPRDMLFRIETMVLMAGIEFPVKAVREQIASAVNLIVHQERFRDGTRKITNITEITGMEGDTVSLQDIFVFESRGVDEKGRITGRHVASRVVPRFIDKIEAAGINLPPQIFRRS
ncbi:MAG: CpaF family protein [Bacillota bacterium]